jgi:hypothetical protein
VFHGNLWTVPVGGGIGRIMKVGTQPVNLVAQFYGNAVHPANTPDWTMATDFVPVPQAVEGQETKMLEKKLKQWSKCHSRRGLPLRKRFGVEWRLRQQADAPHCEQGVTLACDQYFNAWY